VAALITAVLPMLQGCLGLVATGAGVGVGALMITDRRSSGAYVEDEVIERKAHSRVYDDFGDKTNVSVTSFNRSVLLTGEAPDERTKQEVERIVAGVPNVKGVTNEIQIAPASRLASRAQDGFITSKVKGRFLDANKFNANHIKVVTEAKVVYLMGLVTRKEADDATEVARTTGDVKKVVRVFEYIGEDRAQQLDTRPPEDATAAGKKP
jgi:osmotically-inducible protein OsmY